MQRLLRRHTFFVVVAAWAITAVLGLVVVSQVTESSPAAADSARQTVHVRELGWNGNLYPLGPPGSPLAEKTTAAGAQAKAGFPVLVPIAAAASQANLTQVWVNTNGPAREVALVFDKGKVDILMHRATYQSDLRYFTAFVAQKKQNRVRAAIGRVNGRRALIITPNTDGLTHSNAAVVDFNRNGVDISISSHSYGFPVLLAIADSMP